MSKRPAVILTCLASAILGTVTSYVLTTPAVAPYYVGLGVAALVALIGGALISDEENPHG